MIRYLKFLCVPLISLLLGGCNSYKVLPDSYMLRGHDYFVNIPRNTGIYLSPEYLENTNYFEGGDSLHQPQPLLGKKLNLRQRKVLREIGYDPKSYSVLFRSTPDSPLDFFAVINNKPQDRENNNVKFLNTSSLTKHESDFGSWHYSLHRHGTHLFYHAILPLSERLFQEKYVGLVFQNPQDQTDFSAAENFISTNLAQLRSSDEKHIRSKTVIGPCEADPDQEYYHGYIVPEEVINHFDYMLLAAYRPVKNGADELVYYRILDKGLSMGAFRICPGEYILKYLTLDGEVRWRETFSPIPQEK